MAASVSALIVQQSTDGQLERLWFAGVLGAIFFALSLLLVSKLKPFPSAP
jgi:uncharacterized membrane protein YdcZ (DUF606 family)